MPNEPYVEEIMVADGDGDHPSTEEVSYETKREESHGGGTDLDSLPDSTNDISDTDLMVSKENDSWVKKTALKIWNYVKTKLGISAQGSTGKYLNEQGKFAVPYESLPDSTNDISDTDLMVSKENDSWVKKSALKLLQYIGIFYGTTAEWEALTTAEKDKYKLIIKTDDNVNAITSAYDIPYGNTSIGNILDKYTPVTLWTGDVGNYAGTNSSTAFNLSQSYKNFKFLRFYYRIAGNATVPTRPMVREISTEQLDWIRAQGSGTISMAWGYVAGANPPDTNYVDVQPTSTDTVLYIASKYCKVQKIEGIEQIVHTQINSIDNQVFDADEHEIGTFFGKTLYRRCIDIGDGSGYGLSLDSTTKTAAVNLATLFGWDANYEVTALDFKVFRTDGGRTYFNYNVTFSVDAAQFNGWYNRNDLCVHFRVGSQYNASQNRGVQKIIIYVEYTKERIW